MRYNQKEFNIATAYYKKFLSQKNPKGIFVYGDYSREPMAAKSVSEI